MYHQELMLAKLMVQVMYPILWLFVKKAYECEDAPGEVSNYDAEAIYDGYTEVIHSHNPRE